MQHSAVLIIPAELKPAADILGATMGWGAVSYTIPVGDGETVTHFAARADVSPQFVAWITGTEALPNPAAQTVIDALISDFSPDPAYEGSDPPPMLWGRAHLDAVLAARGLESMTD